MGFRFRKSVNLGGGARLNFNKKSVGISAGTKGARVSVNSDGRKTTSVGVPGTGLYYMNSKQGSGKASSRGQTDSKGHAPVPEPPKPTRQKWYRRTWFVILMLIFVPPVGVYLMWRRKRWRSGIKSVITAVCIVNVFLFIFVPSEAPPTSPPTSQNIAASTQNEEHSPPDSFDFEMPKTKSGLEPEQIPESESELAPSAVIATTVSEPNHETVSAIEPEPAPQIIPEPIPESQSDVADTPAVPAIAPASHVDEQIVPEATKQEGTQYVWATATGSKYHSIPNCGRTKNAAEVTLEEAEAMGLTPCSKCY